MDSASRKKTASDSLPEVLNQEAPTARDAFRQQVQGATVAEQLQMLRPPRPFGVTAGSTRTASSQDEALQLRSSGAPVQFEKTKKTVTPKAMGRLGKSRDAIGHTKKVLEHGAGNQKEALKATNFNSYFRMAAMRDPDCWVVTADAQKWADKYPQAMTAAKADLAAGGNCGEHAAVAYDYLRVNASSDTVNRVAHTMDHAFVLIGNLDTDGSDIVACDPWPTNPTACLFDDHFGYTTDPKKLKRLNTVTGDDKDVKAIIAKGLSLSAKGKAYVNHSYDEERTKKAIEDGRKNHPPSDQYPEGRKRWIWIHPNTATTEYDYVTPAEVATAPPAKIKPAPDSVQDPAHAEDGAWARFLAWVRSWIT